MSEEAQDARNKEIKKYRAHFSRISSRMNINTNIFQQLLLLLNLVIININHNYNKRKKNCFCVSKSC